MDPTSQAVGHRAIVDDGEEMMEAVADLAGRRRLHVTELERVAENVHDVLGVALGAGAGAILLAPSFG